MTMTRRHLALLFLLVTLSWPLSGAAKVLSPGFSLKEVTVKGKQYYATYRVSSKHRSGSLMDTSNKHRWFNSDNSWQYGSGFYLFTSVKDAKKYIGCSRDGAAQLLVKEPHTKVKARESILEVLIPKDRFDAAAKAEVGRQLNWVTDSKDPRFQQREQLRRGNQVLFGRWTEDPAFPFAANKPMVGTPQLAVIKTTADSMLNDSLVRLVSDSAGQAARLPAALPRPVKSLSGYKPDPGLPRVARIKAVIDHNRGKHNSLHQLLSGTVDRHQGKQALDYLIKSFPEAGAYLPRESGTWEGFTVKGHTLRAYNVLGSQLRHVDLQGIARAYPGVDVKRTLQLALLLHDVGKPVALDKARALIDQTLAAGKSLDDLDRSKLKHHAGYSNTLMSRVLWRAGMNPAEIRLARALVGCNALGQLEQGKISMTGARDQVMRSAERAGMETKDFFKLQTLFYTADAGAYRSLRRSVLERKPSGQLVPTNIGFQMMGMQLGD